MAPPGLFLVKVAMQTALPALDIAGSIRGGSQASQASSRPTTSRSRRSHGSKGSAKAAEAARVEAGPPEEGPRPATSPGSVHNYGWDRDVTKRFKELGQRDNVGILMGSAPHWSGAPEALKILQATAPAANFDSTMRSTHTFEIAVTPRDLLHIANNRRRDVMTEFQQVLRVQEPMLRKLRRL